MLTNIVPRLDEEEIQELLSWSVFPDPERLQKAIDLYRSGAGQRLLGYLSEDAIIGLIGFHREGDDTIVIDHISVTPEERSKGYGRGMILELLALENPAVLIVETDEEAVDFYRSSRFTVISMGEKYPGTERFRCTYRAEDMDEEDED